MRDKGFDGLVYCATGSSMRVKRLAKFVQTKSLDGDGWTITLHSSSHLFVWTREELHHQERGLDEVAPAIPCRWSVDLCPPATPPMTLLSLPLPMNQQETPPLNSISKHSFELTATQSSNSQDGIASSTPHLCLQSASP